MENHYGILDYFKLKIRSLGFKILTLLLLVTTTLTGQNPEITLTPIGTYATGVFDEGAAEIVVHDPATQRLFVVNGDSKAIDVLDIKDPTNPNLLFSIEVDAYGAGANSVAVSNGLVAVAVQADPHTDPGQIVIFDTDGNFQNAYPAGALPDAVVFTADGNYVLSANEGEPNDEYTIDPEGSITIVHLPTQKVSQATFTKYNKSKASLRAKGVRIFGPNATVAQDLEPEYIAISTDGRRAYVTLQENNAYAIVNIANANVERILGFGEKDHGISRNGFDASDRDDAINIRPWKRVYGMYQPDAIASFEHNGKEFLITANEGDARDYDGFSEETRIEDVALLFNGGELQNEENLGRLTITNEAITNTRGTFEGKFYKFYSFGARSFSIWSAVSGKQHFDSGNQFEKITSQRLPQEFNSSNDENGSFDSRSDAKGPEPEGVVVGMVDGRRIAFIGLERIGGIMMYDISNPYAPKFMDYVNNRNFDADAESAEAGDLGPEGLFFITAEDSPNGSPLLAVGNEVSGTTTIYQIGAPSSGFQLQVLHASDLEGGVEAIENAPNFAAIAENLEKENPNTLILSAGDNYIPGPFFGAAGDGALRPVLQSIYQDLYQEPGLDNIREGDGRADITIMNIIGFDASAVGNHEFDAGTNTFGELIGTDIRGTTPNDIRWLGSQFPYLSANLDFSADGNLSGFFTEELLPNTDFLSLPGDTDAAMAPKIAPFTTIEVGGEIIGVVGATTQLLNSITSNGDVTVQGGDGNDMSVLANTLQPFIDLLENQGINKIILVSHLQQVALEKELIGLLSGVDVVIAGGSDVLFANPGDVAPGDTTEEPYPLVTKDSDGNNALIVGTPGEYSYLGKLVVDFDDNGMVVLNSGNGSRTIPATEASLDEFAMPDPFAIGTRAELVKRLSDAVQDIIEAQDGNIFGQTAVFLEGRREAVRTQETNLGNLTADANLAAAQAFDSEVKASIKNGGGIRAQIGEIADLGGGNVSLNPPPANPNTGKEEGQISELDIKNSLRFNNALSIVGLTAQGLLEIVEHSISATEPGATPGQFPQIGGMAFSFDPDNAPGGRVQTLVLQDADGNTSEVIAENGTVVGDADRIIKIVTLNFMADGGDGYPFPELVQSRVDLHEVQANNPMTTFAPPGTEQYAMANYLADNHADQANAFNMEETGPQEDQRIQDLNQREDGLSGSPATAAMPEEPMLQAYPIPLKYELNVDLPRRTAEGVIAVSIQDLHTGQELYRGQFDSTRLLDEKIHFDVSNIQNPGLYSLKLVMPDGQVLRRKILK